MRSIFVRIYMGMFMTMLVILLIVSIGSYYLCKYRINQHIHQYYGGTFQLIGEGASRHQGEKQRLWLSTIETLSALSFKQVNIKQNPLSQTQLTRLHRDKYIIKLEPSLSGAKVLIALADQEGYLVVKLTDFGSSLVRTSAFLMVHELGRHKSKQRLLALKSIKTRFNYPIELKTLKSLHLSNVNVRNIKKEHISVLLKNSTTSVPSLTAYAPLGHSHYVLVLADIPLFEWFPLYLILFAVIAILLLMAFTSFLLVRPLEKRLASIDKQVEKIGLDKDISMVVPVTSDAIGKLSTTVNAMAQRIQKLIDAQTDMIRAISHELRTPVTRVRFRVAVIEEHQDKRLKKQAKGIEKDLDELENLIDEVLTFSRLKQNLPELTQETISVDTFFKQLSSSIKMINPDRKISYPADTGESFIADRRYLHRAISNLVINALKYADKNVEIGYNISTKQQKIWIADDGPGIPEKDRSTIFDPFKRLDASRDRQSGGYGLGLAIVKQIAHWHKGDITITDNNQNTCKSVNKGAKLIFCWPKTIEPKAYKQKLYK